MKPPQKNPKNIMEALPGPNSHFIPALKDYYF